MTNRENQLSYRFNAFKRVQPMAGDYIHLSSAVRGMKYGKMQVFTAFNKYVPKGDYAIEERDMLMENLVSVTNQSPSKILPLFLATEKKED